MNICRLEGRELETVTTVMKAVGMPPDAECDTTQVAPALEALFNAAYSIIVSAYIGAPSLKYKIVTVHTVSVIMEQFTSAVGSASSLAGIGTQRADH